MIKFISQNIISRFFLYLIALFILGGIFWVEKKFGPVTIDQFLFHFLRLKQDVFNFDQQFLFSFIKLILLVIFLSAFFVFVELKLNVKKSIFYRYIPFLIGVAGFLLWFYKLNIYQHVCHINNNFFERNYVDPKNVHIIEKHRKNLVLIYVEGLENSYSENSLFGRDLLLEVKNNPGISFKFYEQVNVGVGWTMAAILSTQCGIPLKVFSLYDGNTQGNIFDSFVPKATCIGDTLLSYGYKNVFMGGASLNFSGKGNFLNGHGYKELWGREQWLSSGRYKISDMNAWGLQDDDLFSEAKLKLDELQLTNEPFNLTLLTVNTHHPYGFFSKQCLSRGAKDFEDIVLCSSYDLSEFIKYIKFRGYLKNTRLVIVGDHLAMQNIVYDKLQSVSERTIFNYWIGDELFIKNREKIVHFDIAPSVLDFIGLEVQGGRYGLGYSGFTNKNLNIDTNRVEILNSSLGLKSDTYNALWFFDK